MDNSKSKLLTDILDSLNEPIITVNRDYQITFMNKNAADLYGEGQDIDTNLPCYEIIHGRKGHCRQYGDECPVEIAFAKGVPHKTLRIGLTGVQDDTLYEIEATPISDDTGNVTAVIEIFHDTTNSTTTKKQQRCEERYKNLKDLFNLVEKAKQEWETAMDCMEDLVMITDSDGKIIRFNLPLKKLFNITSFENILQNTWDTFLANNDMHKCTDWGDKTIYMHTPSKRSFSLCEYAVGPSTGGNASGKVITLHDMTTLVKMNDDLEDVSREIEKNRTNLQEALDAVTARILQVTAGKDISLELKLSGEKTCWTEMRCKKKDCPCFGKAPQRCWQIAGTFCKNKSQGVFVDKFEGCVKCPFYKYITSDPTVKIGEQFNNMMAIIVAKNSELEDAYKNLKDTHSQLLQQEKMASIGQLAAGVAHEINNPIGFVSSNLISLGKYSDNLQNYISGVNSEIKNKLDEKTLTTIDTLKKKFKVDYIIDDLHDLLAESAEGIDRVREIVKNLKSFSRVDQAEHKASDINECLESTLNIVWNELKYKTTLNKDYGKLPLTKCYPQQLNQVFMNLLVNAAQAIEKQGVISIKSWADDDFIYITIADDGSGIDPEHIDHLFEPFFTTKPVGEGTGLGLSIAYDIITEKHNGELSVVSKIDKGTTFMIKLPIVEDEA